MHLRKSSFCVHMGAGKPAEAVDIGEYDEWVLERKAPRVWKRSPTSQRLPAWLGKTAIQDFLGAQLWMVRRINRRPFSMVQLAAPAVRSWQSEGALAELTRWPRRF
jgi:hypothetical protein